MLVKICGITTREAAIAAVEAGADFIGFVFAESKRKITPAKAAEIAKNVPVSVKKVGVFVNEKPLVMREIASEVGLDFIQLHGDESSVTAESLPVEIIKALPAEKQLLAQHDDYPCDYLLVDTPSKSVRGGTGKTFDWDVLNEWKTNKKLILAGGLTPENVQQAIKKVKPVGVDVSSGVETDGKKDIEKIRQFIKRAKEREDEKHENIHHAQFTR
ncbi:phosphoribosylanthranilate isomerase [Oceanobacillus luteolus]|uniref:N-(5'-phosphoribosyl)anthranilate isomerase n=1 Tax=Oceanobacillus luteolus TaxID=1274358 RepID=A0ABW4HV33_9BACI|nr:phosphoribosylanthranilate isomerase [Oceanobacillus luteolus]MCM3741187.1 phosphoribosylanthranilate isomerase [Oceanobacillus luteolus]